MGPFSRPANAISTSLGLICDDAAAGVVGEVTTGTRVADCSAACDTSAGDAACDACGRTDVGTAAAAGAAAGDAAGAVCPNSSSRSFCCCMFCRLAASICFFSNSCCCCCCFSRVKWSRNCCCCCCSSGVSSGDITGAAVADGVKLDSIWLSR